MQVAATREDLISALARHRLPSVARQWAQTAPQLAKHRLPRYSALRHHFHNGDWEHNQQIARLWTELFEEAAPVGFISRDWITAEELFLRRFHRSELAFPLDTDYMSELAFSADEYSILRGYPIMLEAVAPNWYGEGMYALEDCTAIHPLAALRPDLLAAQLADSYDVGPDEAEEWAFRWCRALGYHAIPAVRWAEWEEKEVEAALHALPEPFSGMVAGWRMLNGGDGNPFLSGAGCDGYDYCWCAGCITDLAELYRAIEAELEAWYEYSRWYWAAPEARASEVVRVLLTLQPAGEPTPALPRQPRTLAELFFQDEIGEADYGT